MKPAKIGRIQVVGSRKFSICIPGIPVIAKSNRIDINPHKKQRDNLRKEGEGRSFIAYRAPLQPTAAAAKATASPQGPPKDLSTIGPTKRATVVAAKPQFQAVMAAFAALTKPGAPARAFHPFAFPRTQVVNSQAP